MVERAPAGWHVDPSGRYERRFWDGVQWTQYVATGGCQGVDPASQPRSILSEAGPYPAAGWYPDPSGSGGHRYWDGIQWTGHAVRGSGQSRGPSSYSATPPLSGPPNNKVVRQARRAGATSELAGGGTLFTEQVLVVNQKTKVFGSNLGYAVYNQNGQQLGVFYEVPRDLGTKISDSLGGRAESRRTRRFRAADLNGRVLLEMTRPQMGWFTTKGKLVVEGPGGTPVGQIAHESFGLGGSVATAAHAGITNATVIAKVGLHGLTGMAAGMALGSIQGRLDSPVEGLDKIGHARFGLEADGRRLGSIHAESTTEWDFNVQDPNGTEVARITKTWAGWAKERFTKADN